MTPREIFATYVREQRSLTPPGFRRDHPDGLTRLTPFTPGLGGVVLFAELPSPRIEAAITAQIEYFQSYGVAFEWKVYDFDQPADLAQRLAARGFIPDEAEAFMVYDVSRGSAPILTPPFRIERITTEAGVDHVVAVQEEVHGKSFPWMKSALVSDWDDTAIFCAYHGDTPIGTGRIEFPERSSFAGIYGGAMLPAFRGRGIYSALFQTRVLEARTRGFRFIAADARPMSRPILLRKGFTYICETTPFHWPASSGAQK